ncbi:MAG: LptA/OstA family protein [Steroidobacteraceae bacterium]
MARSFPELAFAAGLLLAAGTVFAAQGKLALDNRTPIEFEGACFRANFNAGTLESCDAVLRQGTQALIKAKNAKGRKLSEGYEDGEWQFSNGVHIEFDDAVLDADSATVVFAGNRLKEVHVKGTKAEPARFSHQLKDAPRRNQGRAATIDYDSASAVLRLAGGTWYTDGRNEVNTASLIYNMNDGSFSNATGPNEGDRVRITIRPSDKRVPPPRTPDRATSQ